MPGLGDTTGARQRHPPAFTEGQRRLLPPEVLFRLRSENRQKGVPDQTTHTQSGCTASSPFWAGSSFLLTGPLFHGEALQQHMLGTPYPSNGSLLQISLQSFRSRHPNSFLAPCAGTSLRSSKFTSESGHLFPPPLT